jgi:hypothetical protein
MHNSKFIKRIKKEEKRMDSKFKDELAMAFSYLELRKAIGILAIALPFVLSLGALILFKTGIQSSISNYYYTGMRDVFVGILCAIAFFMLSYKGYELSDKIAGNLGCLFAVGVALFPMTPESNPSNIARIIGSVHLAFAALFFLTLIYFSLRLFTKTDKTKKPTRSKLKRNKVYKACGYTMSTCIALIAIYLLLPSGMTSFLEKYNPIYWLETFAVLAFGISWLTKSEAILKDEI